MDILDIDIQLSFLKLKWIQRLLNLTNALWNDLMLYRLNIDIILNSNQILAILRQKQFLRYNRHKNFQKQSNEDFFSQLLNAWLHFTNNKLPAPMLIEEILDQPIHLNPYTKLEFSSDNPSFYCIASKNISGNYNYKSL